jgi:ribose transport system ATP-binding protein
VTSRGVSAGRLLPAPARLVAHGLSKRYGSTQALDNVEFELRPGEIHALLGANGAGKSTLIEIVAGVIRADEGAILIDGRPVEISEPADARRLGIGVIHQELALVPSLTVAENFLIKLAEDTPPRAIRPDRAEAGRKAIAALSRFGLSIRPSIVCEQLGFGERQLTEIAIAISSNVRILVMDEPTSGLSDVEQARLFDVVRAMAADGVSVIYVTHRMDEVFELADRITVLRAGRNVGLFDRLTAQRTEVINAIVGRELARELVQSQAVESPVEGGQPIFEVSHFHTDGVRDVSFTIRRGEIVGMYGVVGSGCSALVEGLFAARPWVGSLRLAGHPVTPRTPTEARGLGLALVPADHRRRGVVGHLSIRENLLLGRGGWRTGFVRSFPTALRNRLLELLRVLHVAARGLSQSVDELSGGTQQKIVMGRWLVDRPRVLLLDDPTQGVDVGTKADLYEVLRSLRDEGAATLLVSSELTELASVADRVLVMRDGRIAGEVTGEVLDRRRILFLATHA